MLPPATSVPVSLRTLPDAADLQSARLNIDPIEFRAAYNCQPLGFSHNLNTLSIFQQGYLHELADRFARADRGYFIAAGAPEAGTPFYSVPHGGIKPTEALSQLDSRPLRILLKRPEQHDSSFRTLLEMLFSQVSTLLGGVSKQQVARLESAILVSSAATTTPIHFDPEMGFFSQIEGEKSYHVYAPADTSESELEHFYRRGVVDIGTLDLSRRSPANEFIFSLAPGRGMHQPINSPHWVQTCSTRSISYTMVFETYETRRLGRTRAFNHYQRKLGIRPATPGTHPQADAFKAEVFRYWLPVRRKLVDLRDRLHPA